MNQVFISYCGDDDRFVSALYFRLRQLGRWNLFFDKSLKPGDNYKEVLARELRNSKYILVILSPASLKSEGVQAELKEGLRLELEGVTKVIPLLVEPCQREELDELLGPKQYADFTGKFESGFKELLSALSEGEEDPKPIRLEAGGKHKPMPLSKKTRIALISILVPAIVALIVGYWQFVYKPRPSDGETLPYSGRVINIESLQTIPGAKVSIDGKGIPPNLYTDSNGIFSFNLSKSVETVRIRVEATNCTPFDGFVPLTGSGTASGIGDIRLKCSAGKPDPQAKPNVGPLGLTFDHNPTVDEVRSNIETIRSVSIKYDSGKCRQLVARAVVRLNGAQLNGADAKDLLENAARPRTDVQFSVVTKQEGASYIIVCNK